MNQVTAFYQRCLKETQCTDTTYSALKSNLKNQISDLKAKNKQAEEAIKICSTVIEHKDMEIENLKKLLNGMSLNSIPAEATTSSKTVSASQNHTIEMHSERSGSIAIATAISNEALSEQNRFIFSDCSQFDAKQLSVLRSIGIIPKEDSTFVATAVKYLYEGKIDTLQNKTLTGRGKNKSKLTPEKVSIVGKMFEERINNLTIDENIRNQRLKKLNTYIKDAISNTNRANVSIGEKQKIADNLSLTYEK